MLTNKLKISEIYHLRFQGDKLDKFKLGKSKLKQTH